MIKNNLLIVLALFFVTTTTHAQPQTTQMAHNAAEAKLLAELDQKKLKGAELEKFLAITESDHYLGANPKTAKVVITTYTAFSCPHCAHFFMDLLPKLKKSFFDTGASVSFVNRLFAADNQSLVAMQFLECKKLPPQSKQYFSLVNTLFSSQESWILSEKFADKLKEIFQIHGSTPEQLKECANRYSLRQKLLRERIDMVEKGGLRYTPLVLINGKPVTDIKWANLEKEINKALK